MLGVMVMYTHTRSHTVAIWEGASNYTQVFELLKQKRGATRRRKFERKGLGSNI